MLDVCIIGGGICGASMARELSQYHLKVAVVEKANDVAEGTTKANSGIVHAGYDPLPGTLMAKYNVEGNRLVRELCEALQVPYQNTGSLVLAFEEKEMEHIKKLYERGIANGVPDIQVLTKEEVLAKETHINPNIVGALYAPSAGVVGPYELAIALMDHAVTNGVEVYLSHEVVGITTNGNEGFKIEVKHKGEAKCMAARFVVNAAGLYADDVHNMLEKAPYTIKPNKGQYYLLDKVHGRIVSHVIFQCPTEKGKGVLVAPTAHGNLIIGPDAVDTDRKEDVGTDQKGFDYVREMVAKSCGGISYRDNIRNFAGNRAITEKDDFIIEPAKGTPRFINISGIKSPGLTSAPAIAKDVVRMLEAAGLHLTVKEGFVATRHIPRLEHTSKEAWQALVKAKPAYGRIVCRCEKVTEGEIIDAIHSPVPAQTVEAVKRRVRAGAGRCQGGFCSPKVVEIIARELGIPYEAICLDQEGSYILDSMTQKGGK